jgi:Mn2+/Fe2+ NRAMP family transporter
MGRHANGPATKAIAWTLFVLITAANIWLVGRMLAPEA